MTRSIPKRFYGCVAFACVALCAFYVSSQSFWIDECNAVAKAMQDSPGLFWARMRQIGGSDLQMPVYMFLLWIWEKLVGTSEIALRSLNILFFCSAAWFVWKAWKRPAEIRLLFFVLLSISPMTCIYMDEARPYAMQLAASMGILVSMDNLLSGESFARADLRLFLGSVFILCGASLTGVVFAAWPCLYILLQICRNSCFRSFAGMMRKDLFLFLGFMLLLGSYYLWTLSIGTGASKIGHTTISTMGFCGYEFFGGLGLGPGRNLLRATGGQAILSYIPSIACFVVFFAAFWGLFLQRTFAKGLDDELRSTPLWITVCCSFVGILSMMAVGILFEMRVLARHWMPAFPSFLILSVFALRSNWKRGAGARFISVVYCVVLLVSSICFRGASWHVKDDYRGASQFIKNQLCSSDDLWWCADKAALEVYGVSDCCSNVLIQSNLAADLLRESDPPSMVVLSKTDIYDASGTIRTWCAQNGYSVVRHFESIDIYRCKEE